MQNLHTDGINGKFALTFMDQNKNLITLCYERHPTYRDLIHSVTKNVRINFSNFVLDAPIPLGNSMMNETGLTLVTRANMGIKGRK